MMRWSTIAAVAGVAMLLVGGVSYSSSAQVPGVRCVPMGFYSAAIEMLAGRWSERVVGRGLQGEGKYLWEVTASASGTWTIILTYSESGMTCALASGQDWEQYEPPADGDLTRR